MTPKLYMTEISPSVRAVLLTARLLEVTLDLKEVDLMNKEQLSSKFLKLNPQHTVPTLEDNGFIIWDSHAIMAYLVGKYGKDDSLYPKEIKTRAIIDQRLHFDSSVVCSFTRNILNPMLYENDKKSLKEHLDCIEKTYSLVEEFLSDSDWLAGDTLTIADLCLIPAITSLNIIVPLDSRKYPKIRQWIKRAEALSCYVANENGLNKLKSLISENNMTEE